MVLLKKLSPLFYVLALLIFTRVLYGIYIPRANEFGCFDDCFNFMGGYFLLQGKELFSEIFYNHAPGMAYISYLIQFFTDPINLPDLILRHRQFVIGVGFIFNLLLLLRFNLKAVGFILWYELTKFYVFGDRFLAEGIIVYPLVYMAGIVWEAFNKKKIYKFDFFLSAIFTWFVIFSREPYVPLAIFLFGLIILQKENLRVRQISVFIFTALTILTLFYHNTSDFVFNIFTVNKTFIEADNSSTQILGIGILKSFFYPIWILATEYESIFKNILTAFSLIFVSLSIWLIVSKKYKALIIVWVLLGLANLRPVVPGQVFYSSFHIIVWYGMFLFFTFAVFSEMKIKKLYKSLMFGLVALILIFFLTSSTLYLKDKPDSHTAFINNYGGTFQVGNVVESLSAKKDTLFLDGFDDIVYWVSQRESSYKYSWYTSSMFIHKKYTDARLTMFRENPPDFYYGTCFKDIPQRTLPDFIKNEYVRLNNGDEPSCLWVEKSKLASITLSQWEKANSHLYFLPTHNRDL